MDPRIHALVVGVCDEADPIYARIWMSPQCPNRTAKEYLPRLRVPAPSASGWRCCLPAHRHGRGRGSADPAAGIGAAPAVERLRHRSVGRRQACRRVAAHSGVARRGLADWRGADRPETPVQRQRNRYHGCHLVPCRTDAGFAYLGQRGAFGDHRRHGRVAGPRGRAETSRRGDRQLLFGQGALVRRTTPAAGGLRRGSRDGRGLWRAVGRRALRAGSDARGAGAPVRAAGPVRFGGCHGGLVAGAARCADLSHPGLSQLRFEHGVGACGRADRGCGFGRLCSGRHLGRSQQAARAGVG